MSKQPFSQNNDETLGPDVGWLSEQGLASLGWAFREAGEVLCEAPNTSDASDEAMFLVAAFAFRQSMELYLKSIGQSLEILYHAAFQKQFKKEHQLLPMWDWISKELIGRNYKPLPDEARKIVAEFERVDPNGTAFRYNIDLKGKAQLKKLHGALSLSNLKNAASEVIYMLEDVDECLLESE